MDNNVLASKRFDEIVDEIRDCGFQHGAKYFPESEYNIAMNNLKDNYNVRAYTKKIIKLYDQLSNKLSETEQADFYLERERLNIIYAEVATKEAILEFDEVVRPLYEKHFKRAKRLRYIDFNQGVDARLVTEEKMKKLAEINIRPLRIAFDHYSMRDVYEKAIRIAAKYGIRDLSNYLLYNYQDEPDELYERMRLNVDLCEELGVTIYSFPMKYHPIDDPEYFQNRDYIGIHWNRKFIRSIQAVLNSTKGKVGRGKTFFFEAFGENIEAFHKILWMPEAFIIHRFKYKDNLTAEWWNKFSSLDNERLARVKEIVAANNFSSINPETGDPLMEDVLKYYKLRSNS